MFILVFAIILFVILMTVYNYVKSVSSHEDMLMALRRENTHLTRENWSLAQKNLQLQAEMHELERQLRRARVNQSIRDNNSADMIAQLQAELRMKDKMLAQKWMTAKAAHAAAKR